MFESSEERKGSNLLKLVLLGSVRLRQSNKAKTGFQQCAAEGEKSNDQTNIYDPNQYQCCYHTYVGMIWQRRVRWT